MTNRKNESLKASYEVQSERALVERTIRKINEWQILKDFRADEVLEYEAWLDVIIALVNLRTLAKAGRLAQIPAETPPGYEYRIFSSPNVAGLPAAKPSRDGLPSHVQRLLDEGPNFAGREWEQSFRPTPLERAKSRVKSCYVLQINCCELEGGSFMVSFYNAASAQALTYLSGLVVDRENFFLQTSCACLCGKGSIEDEEEDEGPVLRGHAEKGGCSHIAAGLEILARLQENREKAFECVVVRKA
jgi:hypothetical protein